jgi:hypothetical protein
MSHKHIHDAPTVAVSIQKIQSLDLKYISAQTSYIECLSQTGAYEVESAKSSIVVEIKVAHSGD